MNEYPVASDKELVTFGVIGLGYVGLPLTLEAASSGRFKVIGVDGARALVDARHAVSGAGVITNGVDSWIVKS